MHQNEMKRAVAEAAIEHIEDDTVIGVGTGSTVKFFIDFLAEIKHRIDGAVASSNATEERLRAHGVPIVDLNSVSELSVYVDGADEATRHGHLIKGGGGALTREKIIAAVAAKFVCIIDDTKMVAMLGQFPLPIEVIPMARSAVARQLVKLGGIPEYRAGFVTDNGNQILDVRGLKIMEPVALENKINQLPGVVTVGLFAARPADIILVGSDKGIERIG